jgi:hypothetical protein
LYYEIRLCGDEIRLCGEPRDAFCAAGAPRAQKLYLGVVHGQNTAFLPPHLFF